MAEEFEQTSHCDMCHQEYLVGRHANDAIYIPRYNIHVCKTCYDCNANGWSPLYEQKLMLLLKGKALNIPERNESGLLPRD